MKDTSLYLNLLAALLCPHALAAPSSTIPEPGPFRIMPTSASERLMFYGDKVMFGRAVTQWRGSTLYITLWPVEFECSNVGLAQAYYLSAEAFHPCIHFLHTGPTTDKEFPFFQDCKGKFNFNIGYQF